MKVKPKLVTDALAHARFRESFNQLPKGRTFQDLSTILVLPTPGVSEEKKSLNCSKCGHANEYIATTSSGLHPMFVEAWKNKLIRPMNVPFLEMIITGMEVGAAYTQAVEAILSNPSLAKFKYILTLEHDNIIPLMPGTQGPLMMLYETMAKGFDVVGGLYWTKGIPSLPLIYGDPTNPDPKRPEGMFHVRYASPKQNPKRVGKVNSSGSDWHDGEIVECNGLGMGFTLFKTDIFRDARLEKPWFKTLGDHGNPEQPGVRQYTQDLYFFEKARKLGYRCAVDTRVKLGHLNFQTGEIF